MTYMDSFSVVMATHAIAFAQLMFQVQHRRQQLRYQPSGGKVRDQDKIFDPQELSLIA